MDAFYFFGSDGRQLFGIHHVPPSDLKRAHGVVLCYPVAHEYVGAYRAFRLLARELAQRGFDVLRFDYHGTGDSSGELDDGSLELWRQNILSAMACLEERAGTDRMSLGGLRLGAALAAEAAGRSGGVDSLALWSPVIQGVEQLEAVQEHHRRWHEGVEAALGGHSSGGEALDLRELPLGVSVVEELPQLDLTALEAAGPRRTLWIREGDDGRNPPPVRGFLSNAEHHTAPEAPIWGMSHELERQPAPVRLIRTIGEWLSRA